MRNSKALLTSKGKLGTVWVAAVRGEAALSLRQVESTDIVASVGMILKDVDNPLRILALLLFGTVRIYSKKVEYLLHNCNQLKCSFQPIQCAEPSVPTGRSTCRVSKQGNKAVHAVSLVVGQQNTRKVKKSTNAVGRIEVSSPIASEGICVRIETEVTIRTSVVIREATFTIPKRFELDSFDLGIAEDTYDEVEDHHQLAQQDTLLEDECQVPYLYESYQRASCSYAVDSACFMPEYIALPNNILDLTEGDIPERENQNADSAWFTPVKDVLSPEPTVAEVKDPGNKSKTWDNSIREVNMNENNGSSACSMTSIPLQESEGQDSQNVLEIMTSENLGANDLTIEASENDSLLGKLNTVPPPGFPEHDTGENESLEPPVLRFKTRIENDLSPSTPEPLLEGIPGPSFSQFRVRTPAKTEKSQTTRKRRRALYNRQDYIPTERGSRKRVRRRLTWVLYDEATVLSNDMMRGAIEDASDLVQRRRKAPHTHLDAWKVAKLDQTSTPLGCITAPEAPENSCEESVTARRRLSYEHSESIHACKHTGSTERENILDTPRKRKLDEQIDFEVPVGCHTHTEGGPIQDDVLECNEDTATEKSTRVKGDEPSSKVPPKKGFHESQNQIPLHDEALNYALDNIDEDIPMHEEHTRDEASCLHQLFMDQKNKEGANSLNLNQVLEGRKRKVSATFFYETLVLKSRGFVEVNQEKPYYDIILSETPQLDAELQRCGN
ncbi:hypothetical protein U9M48_033023 [Paspalum notatum var. saurae]|uniref:Sister chromatid cohesion 1 protein 2 n=1 Tax=Paspalum notatum var. saurae TaxID=547442 RepID=A0AAQ3U8G7_PASNO